MVSVICAIVIVLLIVQFPLARAENASFKVSPSSYSTVSVYLKSGDRLEFTFQAASWRGSDELGFSIRSPSGYTVYDLGRVKDYSGSYSATDSGTYQLYFDNSFSTITSKTVTLQYDVVSTPVPGIPVPAATEGTMLSIIWILVVLAVIAIVVGIAKAATGPGKSATAQAVVTDRVALDKYCRYCGGRIADDGAFCSHCGKSLK